VTTNSRRLTAELNDAANRLTAEFGEMPPGSVLRCLSRAVFVARRDHVPAAQLASVGESRARHTLGLRLGPIVPRQRGAG
jgi:hypothetical protein